MGRLLAGVALIIALSVGLGARAQEASTPEAAASPDTLLCATPLAEAAGGTPVATTEAPETAATPGGVDPGTPVGLFPCGTPNASPVSSDGAASPATTPAAADDAAGQSAPVVVMVDIAFQPTEIVIPANTDVTIQLTNNGVAVHNFQVDELNVHSGDYMSAQAGTVTVNAPAGSYQYYCSVPGHKDLGMVGTLTVQ